jgi:tight adherence protein C
MDRIAKEGSKTLESELNQHLFVRIIRPVLDDISKSILKVTPKEIVTGFERKVIMAGNPFNLSVKDWINIQVAVIICLPLITIAAGYYRNMDIRNILFMSVAEGGLGLILPNLVLSKKVGERQKQIRNSLPDVLDLLTVSVEAGLGFDGALAKVIDKTPGSLADEFGNVLQEIKVGKQKRDALRDMADRLGVMDLTTFVGSIIQADQLGVSIGNVLRIQSEQMRQKRRQRAQEKAMKAPVKMLIPMVLFIFPTIFSVLIGPVAIRVLDTFMK